MTLPNIKDQARINPPHASVVVGRTPMIRWHDNYNGARRSALGYGNTRYGRDEVESEDRHHQYAKTDIGVGVLKPDGSVEYVEQWKPDQRIEWRR